HKSSTQKVDDLLIGVLGDKRVELSTLAFNVNPAQQIEQIERNLIEIIENRVSLNLNIDFDLIRKDFFSEYDYFRYLLYIYITKGSDLDNVIFFKDIADMFNFYDSFLIEEDNEIKIITTP
ncbi:MAG: hypothetical protein NZM44_06470, partial [Candidatus Calescibacterium sp.]|nr:hypothetical protein [Candidatus Calescibacterium sp.]